MSYIGSTPTTQSFIAGTDSFNGTGSATNFTLSRIVNSVNDIQVVVNNVVQYPPNYSVSGTTLTISPAPSSGTNNVYVRYLSTTLQSVAPSPGTTQQFASGTAANPSITFIGDTNTGIYSPGADTIAFVEGGTEAMRIDSSANVGIGTASPVAGSRLVVVGGGTQLSGGTSAQEGLRFQRISGAATITGINNDNNAFNPIAFYTSGTEAARIDSSGTLFVGGTSNPGPLISRIITVANGLNGVEHFLCNEQRATAGTENYFRFYRNNVLVGSITNTLSNTAYNTSSDYRLKENIQPMSGALSRVAALKPVTYTWKVDGSSGEGFIAHELQAVVPDCVTGEKDAVDEDGNPKYQGVDTSFLVATLTAAIQEQQAMIDTMKQEIAELKAKVGE
jgi:Chaperone of endosialidase